MDSLDSPNRADCPPQNKQLACKQCRARKVKCDRRNSGCERCEKLELTCSYVADTPQPSAGQDLTEAGIKRRRILRACTICRLAKAKCSGTMPCARCQAQRHECQFGGDLAVSSSNISTESPVSPESTLQTGYGSIPSQDHSMDMSNGVGEDAGRIFSHESRDGIRKYLDTYFDNVDIADCVFLHRATTIAEWSQGKLDSTLLKAICASAIRLSSIHEVENPTANKWITQVQHILVNNMGDMSVPKLQALMLVVKFRFSMRFTGDVWVLLSVASRVAFTKRLNYERPSMDPVKQECLRRLMWSIYSVDKIFSGGIEDLTICPTQRMHIRLPCSQHDFQLGLKSKAPFLGSKVDSATDLNVLAYLLRLYDIRDRVLRYTRQVILSGNTPYASREQLRSLDLELTSFEKSLPDELQLNDNRLMLMCHSDEARTYTTLHTILLSSRCDLHRFLTSGIREAVSPEAINQTPTAYIEYCQHQCLQTALRFIDMWSKIRRMETSSHVGTTTFAVVMYQFVKMIDSLAGLLPSSGESSLPIIQQKLTEILLIVSQRQPKVELAASCVTDIENLIPRLGTRYISPSSPISSPGALRLQEKLHRRSKHAFAPEDEEEEDPAVRSPHSSLNEGLPEADVGLPRPGDSFSRDTWSFPIANNNQQLTESVGDASLDSFASLGFPLIDYDTINSTDMFFGNQDLGFPLDQFDL
ncbi:hypothetical protein FSPOR_10455 [Fusarium sporotrichioides]|uniref:Zn(2)-C6 fungal-type domain-containing protein n=1 Tax=Fusarium sporotrichioides TaxID=5514 RepID=A0A395RKY7_FUSSP|nr:hypothetical protein FSPOR_10455 [Fusarium sporotrichioides]